MEPQFEIKHVMLFAALRPGTLMLVECTDGSLRVLRDELPVEGCRWDYDQVDEAAAGFRRLRAELDGQMDQGET
jgi:hypothetical protein